ncbi:hypothetical protein OVA13_12925 [Pseudoxanthomonas sp. SL93]|uniref:hypothetical protein n=1 Tax=Pseudoxanthomonas sp. SL93 TaxID=2995142 RepID=UPI00226DCFB4|nr:hypothetical protein [Pseudoxanthomonas sp. SL93]WAC62288.1 hypothetical protein OVA13_12925 [Pseudoxanthomonas sp. SL93]
MTAMLRGLKYGVLDQAPKLGWAIRAECEVVVRAIVIAVVEGMAPNEINPAN